MINSRIHHYEIISKIGNGTFGNVYKGIHIRTGETVAIKTESKTSIIKTLKYEAKIYQYLNTCDMFPKLKWFGTTPELNAMVIEYYETSLLEALTNKILTQPQIVSIGRNMVSVLQTLHNMHLIHRDVKPANFVLTGGGETIKLIDFGMSKRFNYDGEHIELTKIKNIIGSPNFVSLNIHELIEPSRRDDLESAFYVFLYMLYGHLPWLYSDDSDIYLLKSQLINTLAPPLNELLKYIRELEFTETPNYEYVIETIEKMKPKSSCK